MSDLFEIHSCGTGAYRVSQSADARMRDVAFLHQVLLTSKARQFQKSDLRAFDYIIPLDTTNNDLIKSREFKSKIFLLREFDVSSSAEKKCF